MSHPRGPKSDNQKARAKYADYCRLTGKPLHILPDEMAELVAHVKVLRAAGMSYAAIAQAAGHGTAETSVSKIDRGQVAVCHRDTYNRIMPVRPFSVQGFRTGRRLSPLGMKRRLRALVAAGFGYNVLGDVMGVSLQAVYQLVSNSRDAHSSTIERVALVYGKLQHADPFDYGATKMGVSRAKGVAKRNNWAPPECWDPDTIDDPAAFPQWTGQCGTWIGARAHHREGIPMCEACRPHDLGVKVPGFSAQKLRDLRERKGYSRISLGEAAGFHPSTIQYWEDGRSVPEREWKIDKLLSVLDATFEDVIEEEA